MKSDSRRYRRRRWRGVPQINAGQRRSDHCIYDVPRRDLYHPRDQLYQLVLGYLTPNSEVERGFLQQLIILNPAHIKRFSDYLERYGHTSGWDNRFEHVPNIGKQVAEREIQIRMFIANDVFGVMVRREG